MKSSKRSLRSYAYDLILCYQKDNTININHIETDDLDKLCSLIINNNHDYGSEVLGPDNDSFDSNILPNLINYLNNTTDKNNEQNFLDSIKKGIRKYLYHNMVYLLDQALEDFIFNSKIEAA